MSVARTRQFADNQSKASDPARSAWVSANAGSGKTHVLVERILRLLLSGAEPRKILCLTYTKAAASEMSNRVCQRLSNWATAPADELITDLTRLMRRAPFEDETIAARRMFAETLDAPGQMRIHTIHAFCERLLQRFPLEAALAPGFTVLDESQSKAMASEAFDAALAEAAEDRDRALTEALSQLLGYVHERVLRDISRWALARRAEFRTIAELYGKGASIGAGERMALLTLFGVPMDATEDALLSEMADVLTDDELRTAIGALALGSTNDLKAQAKFEEAIQATTEAARANALESAFLTDGSPRKSICTKQIDSVVGEMLASACEEFHVLFVRLNALRIADASAAMLRFLDAVRQHYERSKTREAALDFDDLIETALSLLTRADAAAWVLYKLDGGIDHILVDEAQDTSAAQWVIVERLAEEFFSGKGASEANRTFFAVGDEKQSIFSFQGAAPDRFAATGRKLRARARAAGREFFEIPLNVSYRSTDAVLDAVDGVFAQAAAAAGLTSDGMPVSHHAHRMGHAGLVELWPVEEASPPSTAPAFHPLDDDSAASDSAVQLAERIANRIARMLKGEELESAGRSIQARDILILVRRRGRFAPEMVDALKRCDVPVAGADRMLLADQLAVQDLVAIGRFMLLPEDDLSLACVLKSPLIGFTDDDLFAIGYERKHSLWKALRASCDTRYAQAAEQLSGWLTRVDLMPPYEFFATLLSEDKEAMRRKLLTEQGPAAADALDEFLEAALRHDGRGAPSMESFLTEFAAGDSEVKRDMEQARNEVRVMTVHGAKGLEANIVFLPDTCELPRPRQGELLPTLRCGPEGSTPHMVYDFSGSDRVADIRSARDARRAADLAEYRRLLYVGMTRARDRLYVCGWRGRNNYPADSWQALVRQGLNDKLEPAHCPDAGAVLRRESSQTKPCEETKTEAAAPLMPEQPPAWVSTPPPEERRPRVLTPSSLDYAWDTARDGGQFDPAPLGPSALAQEARFARGRIAHVLLQHLPDQPEPEWERTAARLARAQGQALSDEGRSAIVAETLAILRDPVFAPLFGRGSQAEVPFVARIGAGVEIVGQVDRLVVLEDGILIVDYKTNRPAPECAERVAPAYLLQLAAYRAAMRRIFIGKPVDAALVWTDGPRLMPIPGPLLDAAERRISS